MVFVYREKIEKEGQSLWVEKKARSQDDRGCATRGEIMLFRWPSTCGDTV